MMQNDILYSGDILSARSVLPLLPCRLVLILKFDSNVVLLSLVSGDSVQLKRSAQRSHSHFPTVVKVADIPCQARPVIHR